MMKTVYDACEIKGGYTPKNEQLFDSGDIPYFKVSDMNREGNHKYMISTELFLRGSNKVFPAGSIVFPKNGGAVLTNKKRVLASDSVVDLNTGIALPKKGTDSKYLFYFFQNLDFRKFIKEGTLPVLRIKEINELPLYLPDIEEQDRIVKILDAAFEKIDRLKENAEEGLQAVKNLWQATLREELKPKEGWKKYLLKEIITDITYGTSVPSCENGEYVYLRMNNITNDGRLDLKGSKTINLSDKELEKCLVKKGDILFNRTNSLDLVGKSCVFDQETPMVIAGYIIRIRLQNEYDSQFVSYAMNYMKSMGMYRNLVVGAVHQANISAKAIQTIHLDLPDLNIQKDIVRKLDAISAKCNLLRDNYLQELDKYEALKQSILRKAFSGEL